MSQIHRPRAHGSVVIDVRLLQEIEGVTIIDDAPPPSVVAPLMARVMTHEEAKRDPEADEQLVADTIRAMDGCWLNLEEAHIVQRLRGWHRTRYGKTAVDAWWLTAARNLLDDLTLSLDSECEETIRELATYPPSQNFPGELDAMGQRVARGGFCGDCQWCNALQLRDECDATLDAAGFDGGSRYRAYVLHQSPDEIKAAYHMAGAA